MKFGIGVQAEVTDGDLSLVGDMRSDPGDELEVVHPLHLFGVFPISVADLTFPFIEGEPFQREQRPDHGFSHPLGLSFCLGPDPAVDIEARVPPGEKAVCPFGAEKLLADEVGQDLAAEKLCQPRVVDSGDFMEDARLVHSALGHQEMQVRVEIYLGSEGLNGRDNPGHKLTPRDRREIAGQRMEGAAAEFPQQLAVVLEEESEHLGDGEDDPAVGDIQKECLPHSFSKRLSYSARNRPK